MAYARRSPQQHQNSSSPPSRKYVLRRSPLPLRRRHKLEKFNSYIDIRQVLVPLHPNLRRLPSRLVTQPLELDKESLMARHASQVGTKRKRVASVNTSNENMTHPTRARTRSKRLRSDALPTTQHKEYTATSEEEGQEETEEHGSDEEEPSEMDVDTTRAQTSASEESESEGDGKDTDGDQTPGIISDSEEEDDSTDDHLLNSAPPKQLSRLRKHDLVRLYGLAGLSDDAEAMKKSDIIEAIVAARDDFAELPPSSPPGQGDGNSSEYCSSDDGNVAGDEETDAGGNQSGANMDGRNNIYMGLRRRATMGQVSKNSGRPVKGRSLSMGHLLSNQPHQEVNGALGKRKGSGVADGIVERTYPTNNKQKSSNHSSPTTSTTVSISSPLITRLRSKKLPGSSTTSFSSSNKPTRGKGKQVEFSGNVSGKVSSQESVNKQRGRQQRKEKAKLKAEESDLTELEELEASLRRPSPRKLRSQDQETRIGKAAPKKTGGRIRKSSKKTRVRRIDEQTLNLDDEDVADDEDEDLDLDECDKQEEDGLLCAEDEDTVEEEEDDELDELVSSASATPTPPPAFRSRRTPVRTRLRPRQRALPPPSDGDDECDDIEEEDEEPEEGSNNEIEGADVDETAEEEEIDDEDDKTIAVEPRRLRNGKIVGDEDVDMEEDTGDEDEAEVEVEDEEHVEGEGEDGSIENPDIDAEGETDEDEDEAMEDDDDVDLTIATAKTLVRLRRDDLVRLCETRDLEPIGTKPQLAEALLEWRDRHCNDFSSPSSSGTVRPTSISKRRVRPSNENSKETLPVLLQSTHVHQDEPLTPVPTQVQKEKDRVEHEPELELDLESLGLEDREIPPEKLQKLEKIGSGGFKDVFIGKFKGRKIAISEFRGQLSAMDIKELKLLGGFDHPNIVRFLGVSIPENTRETPVMIVSELCSNGDLFDYIRNVNPPTLHKVLVMMLDIARGLEYLHLRKPSVIHRDCKSSNILITAKGTAKIADFGLAKVKQSTRSMVRSLVGTVNWQAPELWHAHPKYNHKVDVFSCAMVYWEMLQWHVLNKKFPWEGMNEHAIYEIVGSKRQRPSVLGLRKQWCTEIIDLIERMWAQEHQDRPTMSEVVEALEEMIRR